MDMNVPWLLGGIALAGGLALGIVVTRYLHNNPKKKGWNERVGRTAFRRANIPVGGTAFGAIAFVLYVSHHSEVAFIFAGAAIGMAAGAIGVGVTDPLPPMA
jgi:hypothetical protein